MFGSDKSLGRPARVLAAVGTIWEASKLGGLNVKEYLQPRNDHAKKSFWRRKREADPSNFLRPQVSNLVRQAGKPYEYMQALMAVQGKVFSNAR